ncbi:MAG TPA: molybdopterin molybdotransferase MoeA, partial [Marinagarivorans sp.]|nr:molybdopterin molybdotransferase MoeA [Marinagarivorans sp.]
MLSLAQAQATLWQQAVPVAQIIWLPLQQALGARAAQAVLAQLAVPPADNSAMDGYALRLSDATEPLPVSARIAAGCAPEPLAPGCAARIFTGGEIPPGADTVVMQENTECLPDGRVRITVPPKLGANIRPMGQDISPGQLLVAAGERLGPVALALLASQGITQVEVLRPVKVALVATGSELVAPGQALGAGQIYNSNSQLLGSALSLLGAQVHHYSVADDAAQTQALLAELAAGMDVIVSTGGVSAGEEDHVKASLAALGQVSFWKIALKPGKPFMFGQIGATPVLGLPGNPASSFITYCLLAKPFIQALQGGPARLPPPRLVPVACSLSAGSREEFVRVEWVEAGVRPLANQSSGALRSLSLADGVVR